MKKLVFLFILCLSFGLQAQLREFTYVTNQLATADFYLDSQGGFHSYDQTPNVESKIVWQFYMHPESESGVIKVKDGKTFIINDYYVSKDSDIPNIVYIGKRGDDNSDIMIIVLEKDGNRSITLYNETHLKVVYCY